MKKFFVVTVLFALPIVAYLFFASGVNHFARLPVLEEGVQDLETFQTLGGEEISFEENIAILGFFGKEPLSYTGHSYNLAEKIYDTYYRFQDLQLVIIVPIGTEAEVRKLEQELSGIIDIVKWKFVFGTPEEVRLLFDSLGTDLSLQEDLSTPYVFLIDKKGHLRGREDDEDTGVLYGYDTSSVAILDDKMDDDVKVILAEYRLELKKYNSGKDK